MSAVSGAWYTDKKENQIFLIYEEIQNGQLQCNIWLTASLYMVKYLRISSHIMKPFLIYDYATAPLWISLYCIWGKFVFFFLVYSILKVQSTALRCIYTLMFTLESIELFIEDQTFSPS